MAALAVILGLIQLIEYGIYNQMDLIQGGRLLYAAVWLFVFIFALSVMVYVKDIYTFCWFIFISVVFLMSIIYAFSTNDIRAEKDGINIAWKNNNKPLLHNLGWLFCVALIVPILLLLKHYEWSNIGLYLGLLYILISYIWFVSSSNTPFFHSSWVYSLTGIFLILIFVGMFNQNASQ
jgi:hypothetical protein